MARCTDCRSDQHNTTYRVDGQRIRCHGCRKFVDGQRVYFGTVGPFCCVPCRDRFNAEVKISNEIIDEVIQEENASSKPHLMVLHLRPVEGATVSFNQGIPRTGKVTKVGPKRTTIAFTYKNGRAGEVAIPHDYLVKNNFGWEAIGWHKVPSLRSTPGQYRSTLK